MNSPLLLNFYHIIILSYNLFIINILTIVFLHNLFNMFLVIIAIFLTIFLFMYYLSIIIFLILTISFKKTFEIPDKICYSLAMYKIKKLLT